MSAINRTSQKFKELSDEWSYSNYLAEAERLFKLKNIRFTPLRRHVFEIILKSRAPIKPYDILEELKKPAYKIVTKPTSVYRCLEYLIEGGVIHRLDSSGAYTLCTHPNLHQECFFLICRECYQVEECCNPQISSRIKQISEKKKYQSISITLEVKGICPQCQKKLGDD